MDRTNTNKWMGCVWGAVLAAALLAGCSTGQVPNQRVYDRYAALMQERRQQQASQAAAAAAAPVASDREKAAAAKPAAKPSTGAVASKPAPAKAKSGAASALASAPKKRQPVAKAEPAPAPVVEPEPVSEPEPAPVVEPEPAIETIPEIAEDEWPPVDILPEPVPEPEESGTDEPEADPEEASVPEETFEVPEELPPSPAPVEVIPEPAPVPVPAPAVQHSQPLAESADGELSAYALRVGDGVAITLRGIPQPEKIECQVDEYGMIPLPLINDVRAEGLSAAELQKTIRQIYLDRGIYKNINVTVLIPTRYYYTQGEFKSQGKFQLVSAITLSQAIAASGYFTDFASGKVLIRRNGVIFKTVRNARKLDRTPEDDILIEPNDIIEAVRSFF